MLIFLIILFIFSLPIIIPLFISALSKSDTVVGVLGGTVTPTQQTITNNQIILKTNADIATYLSNNYINNIWFKKSLKLLDNLGNTNPNLQLNNTKQMGNGIEHLEKMISKLESTPFHYTMNYRLKKVVDGKPITRDDFEWIREHFRYYNDIKLGIYKCITGGIRSWVNRWEDPRIWNLSLIREYYMYQDQKKISNEFDDFRSLKPEFTVYCPHPKCLKKYKVDSRLEPYLNDFFFKSFEAPYFKMMFCCDDHAEKGKQLGVEALKYYFNFFNDVDPRELKLMPHPGFPYFSFEKNNYEYHKLYYKDEYDNTATAEGLWYPIECMAYYLSQLSDGDSATHWIGENEFQPRKFVYVLSCMLKDVKKRMNSGY